MFADFYLTYKRRICNESNIESLNDVTKTSRKSKRIYHSQSSSLNFKLPKGGGHQFFLILKYFQIISNLYESQITNKLN